MSYKITIFCILFMLAGCTVNNLPKRTHQMTPVICDRGKDCGYYMEYVGEPDYEQRR